MSDSTKAASRGQTPSVGAVTVAIWRWLVAALSRPDVDISDGYAQDIEERVFDTRKPRSADTSKR